MSKRKDYTGQRYGRLLVLRKASDWGYSQWWCKCDCGTEFVTAISAVTHGKTTSCGCYRRKRARELCATNMRKVTPVELIYSDNTVVKYPSLSQASRDTGIPRITLFQHRENKKPVRGIYVVGI